MDSNLIIVTASLSLGCLGFLIGLLIKNKKEKDGTLNPKYQIFRKKTNC